MLEKVKKMLEQYKTVHSGGEAEIIEKKSRRGKIFYGCTNFPTCEFTSWYKPTDKKCEKCGNILFEKNGRSKGTFCQKCDVKEK